MSEGMRDYLIEKGVKKVYSSYGASDLELNISSENDFTISLRRVLRDNKSLRKRILKFAGALPMIFQYNPADFLIEESDNGELITTIWRPDYIAPKIRYNVYDKGHILQYNELLENIQAEFFKTLEEVNQDFKKAHEMANDENIIKLIFFEYNTGSFAKNDIRIKAKYLN